MTCFRSPNQSESTIPPHSSPPHSRTTRAVARFSVGAAVCLAMLGNSSVSAQTSGPAVPKTTPTAATVAPATTAPVKRRTVATGKSSGSKSAKSANPAPNGGPAATGKNSGGLGQGTKGDKVLALQERLKELKYDITEPDGRFGDETYHAVMAFQKVNRLARTGRANVATLAAMDTAVDPAPLVPAGGADRIEIDLVGQYLGLYQGNTLVRLLSISSGSGKDFCVLDPDTNKTECDKAITPGGSFRVARRVIGWRESKLGLLYNPLYFNGGIAIHGAASVPGYPASHGCVRIPMTSSQWFPELVADGTPVYVSGGAKAPVPLNAKAPGEKATTTIPGGTTTIPGGTTTIPGGTTATTTAAVGGSTTAPTASPPATGGTTQPTTGKTATSVAPSTSSTAATTTTTGLIRILPPAATP